MTPLKGSANRRTEAARLLTDEVTGSVDDAIADNDAMFERHAPADEAWNHYFLCGRSALRRTTRSAAWTCG